MVTQQWEPFDEYGLQHVVVRLFKNRKEGRLTCRSGENLIGLIWADGTIQSAYGNQVDQLLTDLLLRRGFFTKEQFSRLMQGYNPKQALRDYLLQSGVVTNHELIGVEGELLLEALAGILGWRTGAYVWQPTSFTPQGPHSSLVFSVDFVRAMLHFEDRLWLGEQFGDLNVLGRLVAQGHLGVTTCDELTRLAPIPDLLDGSRTLRQVVVASGVEEFLLLKGLHAWRLLGFLTLGHQPSVRETTPLPRLVHEVKPSLRMSPDTSSSNLLRESTGVNQPEQSTQCLTETVSLPLGSRVPGQDAVPLKQSLTTFKPPIPVAFEERDRTTDGAESPMVKRSKRSRWLVVLLFTLLLVAIFWLWQPWQRPNPMDGVITVNKEGATHITASRDQPVTTLEEPVASLPRIDNEIELERKEDETGKPGVGSLPTPKERPDQLWHQGLFPQASQRWRDRLAIQADGFTLGLFMACDLENIDEVVNRYGADTRLFILPRTYQGQACFWVCWGQFADRAAAEQERNRLPVDIVIEKEAVRAYPISFFIR